MQMIPSSSYLWIVPHLQSAANVFDSVKSWMNTNTPHLNPSKAEFLLLWTSNNSTNLNGLHLFSWVDYSLTMLIVHTVWAWCLTPPCNLCLGIMQISSIPHNGIFVESDLCCLEVLNLMFWFPADLITVIISHWYH